MRRSIRAVVLSTFAVACPLVANGSEGFEHGTTFLGLPMGVWQAANLISFLVLLVWLLRKPAKGFFGGRSAEVAEALRKAEEQRRRGDSLEAQLKGRLAELEKELHELKRRALADTEAERVALAADTETEVARVVARAREEMNARVREARTELTAHAGDLAVEIARDILTREVSTADQKRFLADGIRQLTSAGKAS